MKKSIFKSFFFVIPFITFIQNLYAEKYFYGCSGMLRENESHFYHQYPMSFEDFNDLRGKAMFDDIHAEDKEYLGRLEFLSES